MLFYFVDISEMVLKTLKKTLDQVTAQAASSVDTLAEKSLALKTKIVGGELDLVEDVRSFAHYGPLLEDVEKLIVKHLKGITGSKLAKTKKTGYTESVQLIQSLVVTEHDMEARLGLYKKLLSALEKAVKEGKGFVVDEKKGYTTRSLRLSKSDISYLLPLIQELLIEVQASMKSLSTSQKETAVLISQKEQKDLHASSKKLLDKLINDEYELMKEQKKLVYHVQALKRYENAYKDTQKAKRKKEADKNTIRRMQQAKRKITALLSDLIPVNLAQIQKLYAPLAEDEKQITALWQGFAKEYTGKEKNAQLALKKQLQDLGNGYAAYKKSLDSDMQQAKKSVSQLLSQQKAVLKEIRSPRMIYEGKGNLIPQLDKHIELVHEVYQAHVASWATYTGRVYAYQAYLNSLADLADAERRLLMTVSILTKERIMQLKLLGRVKRQHVDLANKAAKLLRDIKDSIGDEFAFGKIVDTAGVLKNSADKQAESYESQIGQLRDQLSSYKKELKDMRDVTDYVKYATLTLDETIELEVKKAAKPVLEQIAKYEQKFIYLLDKLQNVTDLYLKDMQKDTPVDEHMSATEKRKLAKEEEKLHTFEIFVQKLERFREQEHHFLDEQLGDAESYDKAAKKHEKQRRLYKKQTVESASKVKKMNRLMSLVVVPDRWKGLTL